MKGRFSIVKDREGRFPSRHVANLDPGLCGVKAFNHKSVRAWHLWLLSEYRPRFSVALITPCSNVKPYPLSPTSRKITGLLRKLGLWNGFAPEGIEWLYLSDLLVLVPYWRAWDYPACCYDLPPDQVLANERLKWRLATLLASAMDTLTSRGLERVVVFLPRKHLEIWECAKSVALRWPAEFRARYTLFSTKELGERVMEALDNR